LGKRMGCVKQITKVLDMMILYAVHFFSSFLRAGYIPRLS